MKTNPAKDAGPEGPPPFERRVVMDGGRAAGVALLLAVPALALAHLLGDRVERRAVRQGGWLLSAETPACARDGAPVRITVRLARAEGRVAAAIRRVELSPDYMERFTDVKLRPAAFGAEGDAGFDASVPAVIELTPDRCGWARGRLGVTSETGERLELELKTFVFP